MTDCPKKGHTNKFFYLSLRLHVIQSNKLLLGITFIKSFAFTLCPPLSIRAVKVNYCE